MRVLITGGAGFLGARLARALEEAGHEAVIFDRAPAPVSGARALTGDVADRAVVERVISDAAPDAVAHLAALLTHACADDPVEGTRVNCLGTATVLRAALAAGVRRLVTAASVASEESVYGATKAFGERLAAALGAAHPRAAVAVLRLGWVYGPGRRRGWNELQQVIEDFARECAEVRVPAYAEPIDWTYVDDAACAIVACLERAPRGTSVYDLRGDRRTVADAVRHLQHRFPEVRVATAHGTPPPSRWDGDPQSLLRDTGFRARVALEEGLDRTVAAVRAKSQEEVRTRS